MAQLKPGVYLVENETETLLCNLTKEEGEEFDRIVKDSKMLKEVYRKQHAVCPKCGSAEVMRTCLGYIFITKDHEDENRATCQNCQWVGIVHDLLPQKETV